MWHFLTVLSTGGRRGVELLSWERWMNAGGEQTLDPLACTAASVHTLAPPPSGPAPPTSAIHQPPVVPTLSRCVSVPQCVTGTSLIGRFPPWPAGFQTCRDQVDLKPPGARGTRRRLTSSSSQGPVPVSTRLIDSHCFGSCAAATPHQCKSATGSIVGETLIVWRLMRRRLEKQH